MSFILIFDQVGFWGFDWDRTDAELQRALTLSPADPETLSYASQIAMIRGQHERALQLISAALASDPLNAGFRQRLGLIRYVNGEYGLAETAFRECLTADPDTNSGHYLIGLTLLALGRPDEAKAEFALDGASDTQDAGLVMASFAAGNKAESNAALERLLKVHDVWAFGVALAYASRGERDNAFFWLDKAFEDRDIDLLNMIRSGPVFAPLHDDARWGALLRKMHLAE